jgi:hypothetical protein
VPLSVYAHNNTSFHAILSKNWPTQFVESTRRVDSSFGSWREIITMSKSCVGRVWENRVEQLFTGSCAWPAFSGNSMFELCASCWKVFKATG